jgi:hypothetical protein
MRLLMIGLLVSLGAMLLAAVGVACHILFQRTNLRRKPAVGAGQTAGTAPDAAFDPAEETDTEP